MGIKTFSGAEQPDIQHLREENDNFFLNSVDCICVATLDGRFIKLNPTWTRVLGWSGEELMARPYIEFVHPDDRNATMGLKELEAPYTGLEGFENRYACKGGGYRWLAWSAFMTQDRVYGVARDVTWQKKNQQLIEDLLLRLHVEGRDIQDLDLQISGTSHDALSALAMGQTLLDHQQVLLDRLLGQDQPAGAGAERDQLVKEFRQSICILGDNLRRATDIISQLNARNPAPGSTRLECTVLGDFLRQVLAGMALQCSTKGHRLDLDIPPGIQVCTCLSALGRILVNLVQNALNHGLDPNKPGRVLVKAAVKAGPVPWVELAVENDGRGIPVEIRTQVFEPFYTTAAHRGGSGLGLAMVETLVHRRLAGKINLETQVRAEGGGSGGSFTRFTIAFPQDLRGQTMD